MTKFKNLHAEWMKEADYRKEYEALDEEFAEIRRAIDLRVGVESITEEATLLEDDHPPRGTEGTKAEKLWPQSVIPSG